ncbi:uncharacterized protein [Procambarus clarkii]|uniref:uncharacterized protein isoform X1 n=1 Tax=Procambarus clarkii TaxID=6728 RepID=UPI0037426ABA
MRRVTSGSLWHRRQRRPRRHHRHSSSSLSSGSCPPEGHLLVSQLEAAFGNLVSSPSSGVGGSKVKELVRLLPQRPSQYRRSSSSESEHGQTKYLGSVKRFLQRPLSLLFLKPAGAKDAQHLLFQDTSYSDSLMQFCRALLHVYRTNTFPPQGLRSFHDKLAALMMSAGLERIIQVWRSEVLPSGTLTVAVQVASPRDGDRLRALVTAWRSLYTTTLPILLALLAPLTSIDVRGEVLTAFRDTVVPYADLPALSVSSPRALTAHAWTLKQMALLLARVGPCRCELQSEDVALDTANKDEGVALDTDNKEENVALETANTDSVGTLNARPEKLTHNDKERINELLGLLLATEIEKMQVTGPVFSRLLHLHHGGALLHHDGGLHHHDGGLHHRHKHSHLHHTHSQNHLRNLQLKDATSPPCQWLRGGSSSVLHSPGGTDLTCCSMTSLSHTNTHTCSTTGASP